MALEKQIHIYSVDTSAFYNANEYLTHNKLNKAFLLKNKIKKQKKKNKKIKILQEREKKEKRNNKYYTKVNKIIAHRKQELYDKFKKNKNSIRKLNPDYLKDNNIVSIFDSALTRILNVRPSTLTENIIIVQAYYFDVLEDIILNGFTYNNEKYVIYTASAGQIRTKKTVFIKEKLLKKYENTLTCGLTDEIINKRGTININKYLAYKALQNSATDEWFNFNIDKCIVVKDFETSVRAMVDFINDEDYIITRKEMDVPIPHTDGCGLMLPSLCAKTRMIRAPWIKGLLVPFDFKLFVKEHLNRYPNCNIVEDIYGHKYNILKDDIQVIFTESQFKMYKFYNNWDEYKTNFKKYNCQIGYCNEEEDKIKDAKINYQMLQTLSDMTNKELEELSKKTKMAIKNIATDKNTMMKLLGATKENLNKNYYQEAIFLYPQLLNDTYSKEILKQIKKSLIKKARSAKLFINGKYTFICPDLYAFSEWLFLGNKNPRGLLKKNEVSCNLYNDGVELDCLRSPHLYFEHCIRINNIKESHKKWFITKGIYTSCHDIISKILQFDVDGDKSLVCREKTLIEVAKRNLKKYDIVPLFYNMRKASSMKIDNETIYNGLKSAYIGGNIGIISNNISKIWNDNNIDLDAIKFLCMENNFVIDYAKTLYKPTRPKWAKEKITDYTKKKIPYFFIYAKDKDKNNVEPINDSLVNKLEKIIVSPNLNFKSIKGRFSYKKIMRDTKTVLNKNNQVLIDKYKELDTKSVFMINRNDSDYKTTNAKFVYENIRNQLLEINNDIYYVVDVLVKYLYNVKKQNKKITLWESFGDILVENLIYNITKEFKKNVIFCQECGRPTEKIHNKIKYCPECQRERGKKQILKRVKKHRQC